MGLTIFYSGHLRDVQHISKLTEEVADICDNHHWQWDLFQPDAQFPLEGLWFCPPGAEAIWLTFLADGRLCDPQQIFLCGQESYFFTPPEKITVNSIVQFGGPEAHMSVMDMMRFIARKYFTSFRLVDESEYWESGNAEKCRDWFAMFDVWMNTMSYDLGKLDGRAYEDGRTYKARVESLLYSGKSISDLLKVMGNPYRKG